MPLGLGSLNVLHSSKPRGACGVLHQASRLVHALCTPCARLVHALHALLMACARLAHDKPRPLRVMCLQPTITCSNMCPTHPQPSTPPSHSRTTNVKNRFTVQGLGLGLTNVINRSPLIVFAVALHLRVYKGVNTEKVVCEKS